MTNWNDASHGDSAQDGPEVRDTQDDASHGDSAQDGPEVRDTEIDALLERLGEIERLQAARAELVERRRVIMFGSAREAYGREIERIDRMLAVRRRVAG